MADKKYYKCWNDIDSNNEEIERYLDIEKSKIKQQVDNLKEDNSLKKFQFVKNEFFKSGISGKQYKF